MTALDQIKETAAYIKEQWQVDGVEYGIILGTGLGGLVNEIEIEKELSYEDIPHFPVSTVEGHKGRLLYGELAGKKVMAMQGRFHYYEGYNMQQVVFPVRVMKLLGIKGLLISNASGGVNPGFEIGDIMVLSDHINLFPSNPLIGPNIDELGPRFPDMSKTYDKEMRNIAMEVAKDNGMLLQSGVYVGLSGPTLETPSEYYYIRKIGGDAVGMSTVPEVIAARHMSIPCFALSVITDLGVEGKIVKVTHEDVQRVAEEVEPKLSIIFKGVLERLA
jgi:purine-nucleoside phosphorylase